MSEKDKHISEKARKKDAASIIAQYTEFLQGATKLVENLYTNDPKFEKSLKEVFLVDETSKFTPLLEFEPKIDNEKLSPQALKSILSIERQVLNLIFGEIFYHLLNRDKTQSELRISNALDDIKKNLDTKSLDSSLHRAYTGHFLTFWLLFTQTQKLLSETLQRRWPEDEEPFQKACQDLLYVSLARQMAFLKETLEQSNDFESYWRPAIIQTLILPETAKKTLLSRKLAQDVTKFGLIGQDLNPEAKIKHSENLEKYILAQQDKSHSPLQKLFKAIKSIF